jgi:two-component system NtrC family sensor kinase
MSTLLTYSKSTTIYNRRLNINRTVKKVLDIRQYRQKVRNITVGVTLPESPLYVKGDSSQLVQVLMNILMNAEEAVKDRDSAEINISLAGDDKWVRISVADNGCGIPEENLDQVFHPFFTTKKVGDGTGLGLSTCYSIVTSHNGLIHAENNDSGGATFSIELPRIKTDIKKAGKNNRNGRKLVRRNNDSGRSGT